MTRLLQWVYNYVVVFVPVRFKQLVVEGNQDGYQPVHEHHQLPHQPRIRSQQQQVYQPHSSYIGEYYGSVAVILFCLFCLCLFVFSIVNVLFNWYYDDNTVSVGVVLVHLLIHLIFSL